jgi:DNA repair protein RecO (recombination protein O)
MRPMAVLSTDALVLRTYKTGESSRIVVLLTRERGKLRAVAKGARGPRSRYQSSLETLSEVRATLYGRQGAELLRLGACELIRSAFPSRSDGLDATLSLSYFAELLDAFAQEGEAEDAVYRLALAVLRAAQLGQPSALLARYLEAWLLRLHGLYPPLDACASCGRPLPAGALRYHGAARGFVCDDCGPAAGAVVPAAARAFLADVFRQAPAALQGPLPAEAGVLEPFHQELIAHHLERALRSQRVLKEVARETGR